MTLQSVQGTGELLACPRCRTRAPRSEWVVLFRRIHGNDNRLPHLCVMKHRRCKELVYFLVEEQ